MDINEDLAKKAKANFETRFSDMLYDFYRETGLRVSSMGITPETRVQIDGTKLVNYFFVETTVEL